MIRGIFSFSPSYKSSPTLARVALFAEDWPAVPVTTKRPHVANVGRSGPRLWRLPIGGWWCARTVVAFNRSEGRIKLVGNRAHGSYSSLLLRVNCPRSVLMNRDSEPLPAISRRMALYKVAWGVLPPGLVQ